MELKPCPRCGSNFLAIGQPLKIWYPRWLRKIKSNYGITCCLCGYSARSIKAWNRRANDEVV